MARVQMVVKGPKAFGVVKIDAKGNAIRYMAEPGEIVEVSEGQVAAFADQLSPLPLPTPTPTPEVTGGNQSDDQGQQGSTEESPKAPATTPTPSKPAAGAKA